MTVDERVGSALSDLAATIVAQPDPAGRVYARFQRSRRRRRTTVGVLAVLVIALIVPVAVNAHPQEITAMALWSARMTQSPRGPLGADLAFVTELERNVLRRERAGSYRPHVGHAYAAAKVVFAADIARTRVALVALQIRDPERRQLPDDALWLTAPAGTTAGALAGPASVAIFSEGLEPLETGHLADGLTVAVAPDGCSFATATLSAIDTWTPEPTDSYLVRTPQDNRAEWWRVTCDGVVRAELPSKAPRTYDRDAAAVGAASTRARGDQSQLTGVMYAQAAIPFGSNVYDPPAVVWSGAVRGGGYGVALASRLVGQGWLLSLWLQVEQRGGGMYALRSEFGVPADPLDPGSFLVMSAPEDPASVLAIAPAGAARVRATAGGTTVSEAAVTNGSAMLLRGPVQGGVGYEALDSAGSVVARAVLLPVGVHTGRPRVENWEVAAAGPTP